MGRSSTAKGRRREQFRQGLKELAALHDEVRARPEVVAEAEAAAADEELQARWKADATGQRVRLHEAGWRRAWAGEDGIGGWGHARAGLKMIHSVSREPDGNLWAHISLSSRDGGLPGWYELRNLHWVMYPKLTGAQLVVPASGHVNIADVVHVWTCLTASLYPDFGRHGTI